MHRNFAKDEWESKNLEEESSKMRKGLSVAEWSKTKLEGGGGQLHRYIGREGSLQEWSGVGSLQIPPLSVPAEATPREISSETQCKSSAPLSRVVALCPRGVKFPGLPLQGGIANARSCLNKQSKKMSRQVEKKERKQEMGCLRASPSWYNNNDHLISVIKMKS